MTNHLAHTLTEDLKSKHNQLSRRQIEIVFEPSIFTSLFKVCTTEADKREKIYFNTYNGQKCQILDPTHLQPEIPTLQAKELGMWHFRVL